MTFLRWALIGFLALGAGCSGDLKLTVTFDDARGLKAGDPVAWGENTIGRVADVRYTPAGTFEVKAEVEGRFRPAVTDQARFLVSEWPGGSGGKRLEMVELAKGGAPLKDGAVVRGSTRAELFGESVSRGVQGFLEDLKRLPGSEAVRDLSREVDRLAEEMGRAGREAQEKLKKEVLPELERRLEELRRKLREQEREVEAEPIEAKLKELRGV